ncbi:MAG: gamma-glutamyl-gamma-aminobutyrate hydrolase family protein [Phycisphaerales bacterium]|nr:gamma-glutamyl-gamma-aminobutyrate hydrolase family protein [Phycisphaerales bacterium]
MPVDRPIIGIAPDQQESRLMVGASYIQAVEAAGGVPLILAGQPSAAVASLRMCHGLVLTGGDDPIMESWGEKTHLAAKMIDPDRQARDLALLRAAANVNLPVLGVCLGMQFMGLEAGGVLNQHLPDDHASADLHAGGSEHDIVGALGDGSVHSRHHQAMTSAGHLSVVAEAPDGVIEAIRDETRAFWLGVQWHPERSGDGALGLDVFRALVQAAATRQSELSDHVHDVHS